MMSRTNLATLSVIISSLTGLAGIPNSHAADIRLSAPPVTVQRVGTHLYYRYSWSQFSAEDQNRIIDKSIDLLRTELKDNLSKISGLKTLANNMLSDRVLDTIAMEAQKSVLYADSRGARSLLPAGFLIYGGVNTGLGFGAHIGASGDLGLVIFPEKVVDIDTMTGETENYIKIDHALVIVPHLHVGLGAGGGMSYCAGAGLIFGGLTSASDLHGAVVSASGDIKMALGADGQVAIIHNLTTKQNFTVITGEFDWGPEASASVDGEGGYVWSLEEVGELLGKQMRTSGTLVISDTPSPLRSTSVPSLYPNSGTPGQGITQGSTSATGLIHPL